jgi:hypothetical protein
MVDIIYQEGPNLAANIVGTGSEAEAINPAPGGTNTWQTVQIVAVVVRINQEYPMALGTVRSGSLVSRMNNEPHSTPENHQKQL